MSILKTVTTTVFGLALMGVVFSPGAKADEWNRKTKITFSGPVEIPGVHLKGWAVLPTGTYVFKVLDSQTNRHIIQIFSEDEKTCYATILAIPNYRLKATSKTVMTFRERPAGEPEALRAWFYPGKNWGEEFVYPKARAATLAAEANTPVLFTTTDMSTEVEGPAAAPVVAELQAVPVMAYQPSGETVATADVVTAPPAAELTPDTTVAPLADVLPATSSALPMIAMFGLLALGGAFGLRLIQKRIL
jgi:hypothetical protein